MSRFIPVHKKTGQRYRPITAEERARDWSREPYKSNFIFEVAEDHKPAPAPSEAKKVQPENGSNSPKN